MLPSLLNLEQVVVSNHAESGESFSKFFRENRWGKIQSTLRPGDVVLMQMGHNDQKEKGEGMGAFLNFKGSMERIIAETKARGATPVLVTPMYRRLFDSRGNVLRPTSDYPLAVRTVAKEQNATLVELRDASAILYDAFGKAGSASLFVDQTHHTNYGAYLLARCVAESLRQGLPELANLVRRDLPPFNPAQPPGADEVRLQASPMKDATAPAGN